MKHDTNTEGSLTGRVAQSITCLQGSWVRSWTSPRLLWRLILKQFLPSFSLPLNHLRRVVVSYKRKIVHEVLVNRLFKLAQEKVCRVRWTDHPTMTIAVDWDVKQQYKQTNRRQSAEMWHDTWLHSHEYLHSLWRPHLWNWATQRNWHQKSIVYNNPYYYPTYYIKSY